MATQAAPAKKSRLRTALGALVPLLLGAAVGAAGALWLPSLLPRTSMSGAQVALTCAVLAALLVGVIAVHEAGHLLGGRLAGFRAMLFVVGPFRVERTGTGIRAALNRNLAIAGGLAVSVPQDTRDLRRRTLLMVAGGPGASLLTGALALGLRGPLGLAALPAGAGYGHQLAAIVATVFGVMSLGIGAATLIPGRTGGFYTDGARILRLLRGGPDTEREVAILALMALSMGGTRARDWDPALVRQGLATADATPFDVVGRQFAYAHALDRGDVEEARRHLEAALALEELLPAVGRSGLLLQAAYFAAVHDGDPVRARALFARAGAGLMVPPYTRRMTEAAVLLAEGDRAAAAALLERAEAGVGETLDRGGAAGDLERIRRLRALAERPAARAAVAEPA
ncbi:MAG TPA: hypothetical protein VF615_03170 [Longimicrobiaceae bacterium]|jgi:hypothetical protein